jgi:DNA-binding response OmpR family regulator
MIMSPNHSACELLTRILALFAAQREAEQGRSRFGWKLDRRTRRLTDLRGAAVTVTKGEYALLIAFLNAPKRPLSREHLLKATHIHEDTFDRSIDLRILRLRRTLERDAHAPRIIETERDVGCTFTLRVSRSEKSWCGCGQSV